MADWKAEKAWSDQFVDEIKPILGRHLIGIAPEIEDMCHATDLISICMMPVRIGCRIRREEYFYNAKYRREFTVRCCIPSGNKTELEKIMEGWGDYLFYGFGGDSGHLLGWSIIDLSVFRKFVTWMRTRCNCEPGSQHPNHDGSSDFRAYGLDCVPRQFPVKSSLVVAQHLPALPLQSEVMAW